MMHTLRPYQREAADAALKQFEKVCGTIIVLPTGCGKTVVASTVIKEWPGGNCLFLAHTQELIYQTAYRLEQELGFKPHIEMNIQGAEVDTLWQGDMVVVGTVQSMISDRRLDKFKDHHFALIVVDECHHATSASYRKVVEYFRSLNPDLKVLGITATPNRSDGTALGLIFDTAAYTMDIGKAISEGWLTPFQQLTVIVDGLDLSTVKVTRKRKGKDQDFDDAELEAQLCDEQTLHEMATPILEEIPERQAIIFTAGVKHAHLLADVLNRHREDCAEAIDGTTDKSRRKDIIKAYQRGSIQYLANCAVLTEGFDAPACSAVVMGRPTKSPLLYTQCVGRGLRPLPGVIDGQETDFDRKTAIFTSAKPNCLILDFVGASRCGVVDCCDVLGGNFSQEVRELARSNQENSKGKPADVNQEDLEIAKTVVDMQTELSRRRAVVVDSRYTIEESDFTSPAGSGVTQKKRGTATDGQVSLLIKLGVDPDTAQSVSKGQAGAMISSIGAKKCTEGQAKILKKYGISTAGVGFKRASQIIDQIASNGWRLPPRGIQ